MAIERSVDRHGDQHRSGHRPRAGRRHDHRQERRGAGNRRDHRAEPEHRADRHDPGTGDGASFPEGAAITFKGSATDLEDGDLNPAIAWTVASATDPDAPQLSVGTGATVTKSLARGSYLVAAGVTDSGGLGIVKQVGITVGCSVVASMTPAEGMKIPQQLPLDAAGPTTPAGVHCSTTGCA